MVVSLVFQGSIMVPLLFFSFDITAGINHNFVVSGMGISNLMRCVMSEMQTSFLQSQCTLKINQP